jgi:lipopolysaccharide transport system ATP-binding protein
MTDNFISKNKEFKNINLDSSTHKPTNSSTDTAIKVESVSKKYCKSLKRSMLYGVKDIARNTFGLSSHSDKLRKNEFWALDNISFEVKKGETLGIIGPNGSGKTTLLKLLNGIFWPDKGKISVKGKVGALIEVGAGFHPLLTGRENIYINAAILGMSKKEVDEKFDDIIEFADIGDFLDVPVKHYSSGMFVRLGFAVAVHCEPDILLVDEILSVGDLSFQNKSLRRLAELQEKTHAVVFVSHNLEHVRTICDKVLLLDKGKIIFYGNKEQAILKYHELSQKKRLATLKKKRAFEIHGHESSGHLTFYASGLLDKFGKETNKISLKEDIILYFDFGIKSDLENIIFGIAIYNENKVCCIWEWNKDEIEFNNKRKYLSKGKYRITYEIKNPNLLPGIYTPAIGISNYLTGEKYEKISYLDPFRIEGDIISLGIVQAKSNWRIEEK